MAVRALGLQQKFVIAEPLHQSRFLKLRETYSSHAFLFLPGGKERLPAMEGLCERITQMNNPALTSSAASLHNHTWHLNELEGTFFILQCLSKV